VSTFSIFIYDDPDAVANITANDFGLVGFDTGKLHSSVSVGRDNDYVFKKINVFRLDGELRFLNVGTSTNSAS
jgi:hypothetical protein